MTTFWQLIQLLSTGKPWYIERLSQVCLMPEASIKHLIKHAKNQLPFPILKTNQQYQLAKPMELLSGDKIAKNLQHTPIQIQVLTSCPSTNQYLLQQLKTTPNLHAQAILTHYQTHGRGRGQHHWQSFIGGSLPLSLAWSFSQTQGQLSALPLVIAIATWRVLQRLGVPAQVKWPNDLVIEHAKLGGILINSQPTPSGSIAIIGVGLNLATPIIPSQNTIGIWDYLPSCSINSLSSLLLLEFNHTLTYFEQYGFSGLTTEYQQAHRDHQQEVILWQNQTILSQGRVIGVDDQGALLLQTAQGPRKFVNGQISLRSKDAP